MKKAPIAGFFLLILAFVTPAQANFTHQNGLVVDQQGSFTMSYFGLNREVESRHPQPYLVPTNSITEFLSFLRYPPTGVQTDATCPGDLSGYEYEACSGLYRGSKRRLVTVDYQCSPFDSDYNNAEPPPPPQYGDWVDSCSYCTAAPGCSDGEGRQDYCAAGHYEKRTNTYSCPTTDDPTRVCSYEYDVYICDRYDYYCYDNCHTTPKCNENLNERSVSICPSASWISGEPARIRTPTCYGNATGINISTYVEYPGHCGDGVPVSCRQAYESMPVGCPAGYDTLQEGIQHRIIYPGNNCSAAPTSYTVTRAPQCVVTPVCNQEVTTRTAEFSCPTGQKVVQERIVRETRYEGNNCSAPVKTEVVQEGQCEDAGGGAGVIGEGSCGPAHLSYYQNAYTGADACPSGSSMVNMIQQKANGEFQTAWNCRSTSGIESPQCHAIEIRAGCYVDTYLYDPFQEGRCENVGKTNTNSVDFTVGEYMPAEDNVRFRDPNRFIVNWTGACTSTTSRCLSRALPNGRHSATVTVTDKVTGQTWTFTVDALKETCSTTNCVIQ